MKEQGGPQRSNGANRPTTDFGKHLSKQPCDDKDGTLVRDKLARLSMQGRHRGGSRTGDAEGLWRMLAEAGVGGIRMAGWAARRTGHEARKLAHARTTPHCRAFSHRSAKSMV